MGLLSVVKVLRWLAKVLERLVEVLGRLAEVLRWITLLGVRLTVLGLWVVILVLERGKLRISMAENKRVAFPFTSFGLGVRFY